jgi:phage terminase large subunit-like protein
METMETIFWLNETCIHPKKNGKKCLVKEKNRLHRHKSSSSCSSWPWFTDNPRVSVYFAGKSQPHCKPGILILRVNLETMETMETMETIFWLNETCIHPKKKKVRNVWLRKKIVSIDANRLHRTKSSSHLRYRPRDYWYPRGWLNIFFIIVYI